jgi:hypothetical protein
VEWPDASSVDLSDLVGSENVSVVSEHVVQVRNADNEWVTLQDGWRVCVTDSGERVMMSPSAFTFQYHPKE